MGSSAQNSSGVHWCRLPEKVPQKVWEALVQSQVRFNRVPEKASGSLGGKPSQVQQGSGEGSGALVQSQVTGCRRRFRRRFRRRWEGLRGFGAEPAQIQQGSGEGSGRLWCSARSGSTRFRRRFRRRSGRLRCSRSGSTAFQKRFWRRFREALVQRQVRFNRVPDKVPEKVWEALVQSQVRVNRVPEKVESQVRFNRVSEKVPGSLGGKPSQVQQGSGEGSGALVQSQVTGCRRRFRRRFRRRWEGLRGFGAEPAQIQQGSGEGSGRLWCSARSGSTRFERVFRRRSGRLRCSRSGSTAFQKRFWRRFREALVQRQVKFNRVPDKVPEKVSGNFGRVTFNWVRRRLQSRSRRRFWGSLVQGLVRTGFPALGFAARFRKISKNKTLRLLGIPPKLIFYFLFLKNILHFTTFYYILLHFITFYYILFTFYYML